MNNRGQCKERTSDNETFTVTYEKPPARAMHLPGAFHPAASIVLANTNVWADHNFTSVFHGTSSAQSSRKAMGKTPAPTTRRQRYPNRGRAQRFAVTSVVAQRYHLRRKRVAGGETTIAPRAARQHPRNTPKTKTTTPELKASS